MKTIACYHGTDRKSASIIFEEGFKRDCWFARHMEHALKFGGNTILVVEFEASLVPRGWQFHISGEYPAWKILRVIDIVEWEYIHKGFIPKG